MSNFFIETIDFTCRTAEVNDNGTIHSVDFEIINGGEDVLITADAIQEAFPKSRFIDRKATFIEKEIKNDPAFKQYCTVYS